MAESQLGWFDLTLPSHGGLYKDGQAEGGKILLRKMTVDEESVLLSQGIAGVVRMSRILSACTRAVEGKPKLVAGQLLTSDRMAILLVQRIRAFGPRYSFTYRCKSCNTMNKADVNLHEDFDVMSPKVVARRMAEKYPDEHGAGDFTLEEPFDVPLPDNGDTVSLRFMRGDDEEAVFKRAKKARMQSMDATDPSYVMRLTRLIVNVNGAEKEALELDMYARALTQTDSATIRIALEDRETGIDTRLYLDCANCGFTNEVPLQFDMEFFQPSRL